MIKGTAVEDSEWSKEGVEKFCIILVNIQIII